MDAVQLGCQPMNPGYLSLERQILIHYVGPMIEEEE
jgi:hypothetical protein